MLMDPSTPAAQGNPVQIDHIILSIGDLERGIADFERMTGVRPVAGGVHPGRGTQNALASLGDGRYIEILAPDPKQPNPPDPMPGLAATRTLTPSGWALGTTDTFALQARLNGREIETTGNMPGSRALPDGSRLEWSTFGVATPNHRWMPFFIKWADPAKQPSRTAPGGCRLESIQIEDPNPDALTHVLATAGVQVPIAKSANSRMTVVLQCPKGTVTFR
jgi:hypothetical protein